MSRVCSAAGQPFQSKDMLAMSKTIESLEVDLVAALEGANAARKDAVGLQKATSSVFFKYKVLTEKIALTNDTWMSLEVRQHE